MKIVRRISELPEGQALNRDRPLTGTGPRTGLVPTMGAFHAGHLALFAAAREENDVVVASLFVNPAQFGANEDLDRYPRDEERDAKLAEESGVDVLFAPSAEEMYPEGYATWVDVGELGERLEGEFRPDHFRGVATVCLKLFNIVSPDRAYFGQKDAQQAAVVKQLVRDLNLGLEIRVVPTVRDEDGLALSSRNAYLSPDEREAGPCASARARDEGPRAGPGTAPRPRARLPRRGQLQRSARAGRRSPRRRNAFDRQRDPGRRKQVSTPPKGKLALPELLEMKRRGQKIVMVTAYDSPGARFAEDAGVDIILVGDTAAMVVLGHEGTTVPVTMDEMLFLTRTGRARDTAPDRRRRHAVRLLPGLRREGARERDPLRQGGGRGRDQARGRGPDGLARAHDRRGGDPGHGARRA